MSYFKFEFKRIVNNKKNKVFCLIFLILLILLILFSANLRSTNNFKSLESDLETTITSSSQTLHSIKGDETIPEDVKMDLKTDLENGLKLYNEQKKALQNNNLKLYHEIQLKVYKLDEFSGQSSEITSEDSAYIKDVLNKEIDFEFSPKAQLHSLGIAHEVLFPLLFSSLFYIIILLIGGISIASDFENESMKLYKTPLFYKNNIVVTHFISNTVSVSICYITIIVFYIVGVGFLNGFGSPNYPSGVQGLVLVDNWKIDLLYLFWGLLVTIFINSFGILLSLLVRRSILVVGIFSFIFLGFDMLKNQEFMQPYLKFLPLSYLEPISLLQKNTQFTSNGIFVGIVYLTILSALFLSLSVFLYKKLAFRKISSI